MYLAKDGIFYLCQKPQIENLNENKGSRFYLGILKIKSKLEESINRVVPQPEAALANGLILGGSGRMSKEVQNNFSKTGMTHVVAVSGYNVTIIAEYLIAALIFIGFWRKRAFWFAVLGVILFVAMIGFPSSAVRAGVMGSLLLWAAKNGRLANSYGAIIFAGVIMLLVNPMLLRWDVGFQLSFLAALGIVALAPFWEKRLVKKHKALGITEAVFLTISAQIFVLPIILYNFHIFSLVSVLANALILPIIPLSMLLVFLVAATGLIWNPLSLAFAWLAYLPLKYEVWVVSALAGLNWASRTVENFTWHWVVVWYLALAIIVALLKKRSRLKSQSSMIQLKTENNKGNF
jgi:competence protein ComEC